MIPINVYYGFMLVTIVTLVSHLNRWKNKYILSHIIPRLVGITNNFNRIGFECGIRFL